MKINMAQPIMTENEINSVVEVLKSGILAHGKIVEEFENEFAKYIDCKYVVACNSGTSALHMALLANGIKEGDEVITTPFSFIASVNSILMCGAKPVFVDIHPVTYNIDSTKIEEKITPKTKAIMPVHLYGNPCNMANIMEIVNRYGLIVIEDACQSHGSVFHDKKVGNFGTGCFSFYPTKNMTTSEGGMITTNDYNVYEKLKMIRNHGQSKRYYSDMLGYNYRMTNISAAIGKEQLKYLELWNTIRNLNAMYLINHLMNISGIVTPVVNTDYKHAFNQFTIRVTKEFGCDRNQLKERLANRGIASDIYYPLLMPEQKHLQELGYSCDGLDVAMFVKDEVLSLPVHPSLTKEDLDYIINSIKEIKCTL
jgi:dTDP-4-amino-4,6-dideoxygalactose transaminase